MHSADDMRPPRRDRREDVRDGGCAPAGAATRGEVRCLCGSLMARATASGIELKCRRCKRVVEITAAAMGRGWTELALHARRRSTG
jgi:phage FluMu protein Com